MFMHMAIVLDSTVTLLCAPGHSHACIHAFTHVRKNAAAFPELTKMRQIYLGANRFTGADIFNDTRTNLCVGMCVDMSVVSPMCVGMCVDMSVCSFANVCGHVCRHECVVSPMCGHVCRHECVVSPMCVGMCLETCM